MIQIFHGDNNALSRKLLQDALMRDKAQGYELRNLDGFTLAPKDLESELLTASLFAPESLVIERLLSRLRSKDKDACLSLLAKYQGTKNIYLWDKKELTKAGLAKLPSAKVTLSKAPTELFTMLENLVPGNAKQCLDLLHQVLKSSQDIVAFTMIARQISYLIIMKSATNPKFPPWQMGKLKSQAGAWTESGLKNMHNQLLQIDYSIKSGTSKLSYADHLDILLSTLLR